MSNVLVEEAYLKATADAIREKQGKSHLMTPADFATQIKAIETSSDTSSLEKYQFLMDYSDTSKYAVYQVGKDIYIILDQIGHTGRHNGLNNRGFQENTTQNVTYTFWTENEKQEVVTTKGVNRKISFNTNLASMFCLSDRCEFYEDMKECIQYYVGNVIQYIIFTKPRTTFVLPKGMETVHTLNNGMKNPQFVTFLENAETIKMTSNSSAFHFDYLEELILPGLKTWSNNYSGNIAGYLCFCKKVDLSGLESIHGHSDIICGMQSCMEFRLDSLIDLSTWANTSNGFFARLGFGANNNYRENGENAKVYLPKLKTINEKIFYGLNTSTYDKFDIYTEETNEAVYEWGLEFKVISNSKTYYGNIFNMDKTKKFNQETSTWETI